MEPISNIKYPDHCSLCPIKGEPKPLVDHKYGDYVILKPTASSSENLKKLAAIYKDVLIQELPELENQMKLYHFPKIKP
ncbi:MAG: hypothetical protein LW832_00380 [Parachlamydia sp.]|jgi:hypothetical protein|nr:hypothetical protein [Parachlamydia sp.]